MIGLEEVAICISFGGSKVNKMNPIPKLLNHPWQIII